MFFLTFPALQGPGPGPYGPIRAHMGPYGPIRALMGPYGPEKSQKVYKRIAFIGAFKGPCTMPEATVCKTIC